MIKVAVVDDNKTILESIRTVFDLNDNFDHMRLVYTTLNPVEFMDYLNKGNDVDVLLLDIRMKGVDGVQFLKVLSAFKKQVKCLMYSAYSEVGVIESAFAEGAVGYLNKKSDYLTLKDAIESVFSKGFYLSEDFLKDFKRLFKKEKDISFGHGIDISAREKEVVMLMAQGFSNDKIASTLSTTKSDIQKTQDSFTKKTNKLNIAEIVLYCHSYDWV